MQIQEIKVENIISKSKVYEWTLNPYVGCQHGCVYCYARFMKRFTGHREKWGEFVDVKINAPALLKEELKRKKIQRVWVSGVCDPYQPLEERYGLTRKCIEIFAENGWPVTIQTKSPLVLRDIEILKKLKDCQVVFTITTADESIRKMFEPQAPPVKKRIEALGILNSEGIETSVMIAPVLPGSEFLPELLKGKIKRVLIDRQNYHYADFVYIKHGMEYAKENGFFINKANKLKSGFEKDGIICQVLF
jgi:DNA repair photolyase